MFSLIFIIILIFLVTFQNKQKKQSAGLDIEYEFIDKTALKDVQTVVMKEPSFNVDAIEEYKGIGVKQFEFRPTNFKQFIGQSEPKEKLKTAIKKIHRGIKCHIFLDGIQGHGKTTLIQYVLPNELDPKETKVIYRVGKQVNEESLVELINEINNSKEKYVILFIDEMDTMDWKVIKVLNPILESFQIAGKRIKPFIFAGATINKHILLTKTPDTMDRISTQIKFSRYNAEEIATILAQYKKQLYPQDNVPQEVIKIISENCKFNPRISIGLLEEYIVEQNIDKVLKNSNIIKDGLTKKDIELLQALSRSKRAMGANAVAMKVGLSQKEYITEYEPFLVEYDYINRVPSRVLTDKGKELLNAIENID